MDASLFISGLSATIEAVHTWITWRDSRRAAQAVRERYEVALNSPTTLTQAKTLNSIVPQPVLDTMGARARKCWTHYQETLEGHFLPGEIDDATEDVKHCICRELRRIYELNGGVIPEGDLSTWWNSYCQNLPSLVTHSRVK
jgi:hypothetical protein